MSTFSWWLYGVILGALIVASDWRGILANPDLDEDDTEL